MFSSCLPTAVAAAESAGARPPAITRLAIEWAAPVRLERQFGNRFAALGALEIDAADLVHLALGAQAANLLEKSKFSP